MHLTFVALKRGIRYNPNLSSVTSGNQAICSVRLLRKQLRCPFPALFLLHSYTLHLACILFCYLSFSLFKMVALIRHSSFVWVALACLQLLLSWRSNFSSWVDCHCIELSLTKGTWPCIYLCRAFSEMICDWPKSVHHCLHFLKSECRVKERSRCLGRWTLHTLNKRHIGHVAEVMSQNFSTFQMAAPLTWWLWMLPHCTDVSYMLLH